MASAGGSPSAGGRRKVLDAELNLVPFIDLLSTCICFLLMTAVWMEVGAVQVKQATGTEAPATTAQTMEMDVKFASPSKLEVAIKGSAAKKGQKFMVEGATPEDRVAKLGGILAGLPAILKLGAAPNTPEAKAAMGKIFSVARVTPASGVSYGDLVGVMDVIRDNGVVNLGVVPVRK